MVIVFFDLETGGLKPTQPNIQLGAVAWDMASEEVLEEFERKILFDDQTCAIEALNKNHYDPEVWKREAISEQRAVEEFDRFLCRHKSAELVSKRTGKAYSVARLAGYNAATFDGPRLKTMFGERFCPWHPQVFDIMQRMMAHVLERSMSVPSIRLEAACEAMGVPVPLAHDALADCHLTIELYRAIMNAEV